MNTYIREYICLCKFIGKKLLLCRWYAISTVNDCIWILFVKIWKLHNLCVPVYLCQNIITVILKACCICISLTAIFFLICLLTLSFSAWRKVITCDIAKQIEIGVLKRSYLQLRKSPCNEDKKLPLLLFWMNEEFSVPRV